MRASDSAHFRRIGNVWMILLGFSAATLLAQKNPLLTTPTAKLQPASEALRDAERYRAERQASAHDVLAVSPAFSVTDGRETDLYLLNLIYEPS